MESSIFVSDIRLDDTVALITGGAGGLARAMAKGLARAGAIVVLADIDEARAVGAAAEVASEGGGPVVGLGCDIASMSECDSLVSEVVRRFGGIHVLVNNAAMGPADIERAPGTKSFKFWEADPAVWGRVIDTNVIGTFFMTRSAVPFMIERGCGRVVNISTSLGMMQRAESSPYSVSKVAIEVETLVWAKELAGAGVTVNSLLPGGAVDTDFVHRAGREAIVREGRKMLQPDVLTSPMVWLASSHSRDCTGMRFVGALWDDALPAAEAAMKAHEPSVILPAGAARR